MSRGALSRRELLGGLLATLAAACAPAGAPAPTPAQPVLPPLEVARLTDLLALARLRWLLLARPREIAAIPWLIPAIGTVVPETNFDRFKGVTGIDLRQVTEAAVASYAAEAPDGGAGEEAVFYLARHQGDLSVVEGRFEQRLTSGEHRSAERPDLVRVAGKIGPATATLVLIGRDILGVQRGGSAARGPARVATLYATGALKKSPTVLAENPLRALAARFGPAPLTAFALGPFEGELARGARGLLAGATALGAAARPSAREGIALAIAVAGDFSTSGEPASHGLAAAWSDLAEGSFGHLLGLDQPIEPPLATHSADAVALAVELSPARLAQGLRAATSDRIEEILR